MARKTDRQIFLEHCEAYWLHKAQVLQSTIDDLKWDGLGYSDEYRRLEDIKIKVKAIREVLDGTL